MPARIEVRRLTAVTAWLEPVRRADRQIESLFEVAVHIAEPHVVRTVGIEIEALVHRRDALTGRMANGDELRRRLLGE